MKNKWIALLLCLSLLLSMTACQSRENPAPTPDQPTASDQQTQDEQPQPDEGEEVGEEKFVYKVVPNDITLKLPAARSIEDNPVHKTKILTVKENNRDIKVGYLMNNSFTAGTNSDPDK